MKKLISISVICIGLGLGGCSMMDTQEVGNKKTIYYDQTGTIKTHEVDEAIMLGDKPTEYFKAAGKIADASERVETARINGILTATEPKSGDSEAVIAWKGAAATLSIAQVGGNAGEAIKSLYYGKDRYDNADSAIGVGGSVATAGVYTYGIKKVMDRAFDASGDKTSITTTGDGNEVSASKVETRNETHANTTGDGSSPVVNNTNSQQNPVASQAESTGATDLTETISGYQEDGLTTGETTAALTAEGHTTDIKEGIIYVDGVEYWGW